MDFSNKDVLPQTLPDIGSIVFHPLERKYLKVSRIAFTIFWSIVLVIGVILIFFVEKLQLPAVIYSTAAAFILLAVLSWVSMSLSFKYSGYCLRERDVLYRSGWLIRRTRAVPLKRIQHVSVQSGPIERRFGLASISLYTAGSDRADFTINGISEPTTQLIKEWISTQLHGELK